AAGSSLPGRSRGGAWRTTRPPRWSSPLRGSSEAPRRWERTLRSRPIPQPHEQGVEDSGGRPPDRGANHLVGESPVDTIAPSVANGGFRQRELAERILEHLRDLRGVGPQHRTGLEHPDERHDQDAGYRGVDGLEGADDVHGLPGEPELLLRLPERRVQQPRIPGVLQPARERDLARMARKILGASGEDHGG